MGSKRNVVAEIEEIRNRTAVSDWDNGIAKLLLLCTTAERVEEESAQQAYFVVASIAAVETYFRWEIRRLIDSGDQRYVNNHCLDDLQIKVNHEVAVALQGRRVTVGELVAHLVGISSFESITRIMGRLLGIEFIDLVKNARDPQSRREQGENAPPLICSAGDTIARVKRAFEIRHIICHEAHLRPFVKLTEVKQLCTSCYEFVLASYYGIAFHRNPNAPLTHEEAYEAASQRVLALEERIKAIEDQIATKLLPMPRVAFGAMQQAWRSYVEREAAFSASLPINGNRGAVNGKLATETLYSKRLDELQAFEGWPTH
jgi:hypothetical protein